MHLKPIVIFISVIGFPPLVNGKRPIMDFLCNEGTFVV